MGILNLFGSKGVADTVNAGSGLVEKIGNAFDKNFTSDQERLAAKSELVKEAGDIVDKLNVLQQQVILSESVGNWMQRSWRPLSMFIFVGIIVCTWILFPLINIFAHSTDLSLLIVQLKDSDKFWGVVELGFGGYVIGRSAEKIVDSISSSISVNVDKK
jgi:hypothetical protein